ncbi:MAG: hypothetical protein V1850_00570 [Candidatus Bathyarchaeota archaeon]
MTRKNLFLESFAFPDGAQSLRRFFKGWFLGTSIFASGLMLSYIFFVGTFGALYSVRTIVTLGANGLNNPFPLIAFILRFYIISYFAIPLGFMFMAMRRGQDKGRVFKSTVSGLIIVSCVLGILRFSQDLSITLSLICFTALTLLMLMYEDNTPYQRPREIINFGRGFGIFYSAYVAFLFLLQSPNLEVTSFSSVQAFLWTLLSIQSISIPLALITTPIAIGISHKQKPDELWFSFIAAVIIFISTQVTKLYLESVFFIILAALLLYVYGKEDPYSIIGATGQSENLRTTQLNGNQPDNSSSLIDKIAMYKGTAELLNLLNRLMTEAIAFIDMKARAGISKDDQENDVSDKLPQPLRTFGEEAANSLNRIADEATALRELTTGEVLKVIRLKEYVPSLNRIVKVQGIEKNAGVKHYIISSRTGHGKTTLMKNFMRFHRDFAYLVIDRHAEYQGIIDTSTTVLLDKNIDVSELDRILAQIPKTELTNDRSILREAHVFSLEQQFNFAVDRLLTEAFVKSIAEKLFIGQTVIVQPGAIPELIYTRIAHDIVERIFERKMTEKIGQGIVVVNEEAQNSFEVNEDGMERNKVHPLIKIVMEGRKYNTSLINISSDPENIPKNIKDNSVFILGSIGTPAIRKLVGEKLGMIYVRCIHELPIGQFFIDEVDENNNYIVFPNHFGSSKGMEILEA